MKYFFIFIFIFISANLFAQDKAELESRIKEKEKYISIIDDELSEKRDYSEKTTEWLKVTQEKYKKQLEELKAQREPAAEEPLVEEPVVE